MVSQEWSTEFWLLCALPISKRINENNISQIKQSNKNNLNGREGQRRRQWLQVAAEET